MSSSMEDDHDTQAAKPDASQIYLLTGKNYRISRSIKVSWFLDNFNKVVAPNPNDVIESSCEELEVLSVLAKPVSNNSETCVVVPSTLITFLGRIYKFVFCLDVSQSLANVDTLSGNVLNEISFESFQNCMRGLVLPFSVPGSSLVLTPELHVSVLGYNGVVDCGTVQVLVEGCLVTQENVELFLSSVYKQLQQMENKNASVVQSIDNQSYEGKQSSSQVTSELSIVAMLKMSILALELLPGTASGGIVIISDGVFGLPNAAMVHALLAQLRSHTVCCSFVKVGSLFQAQCSFGYIPNTDLMKFLANATSGAYMSKAPAVNEMACDDGFSEDLPPMNFYHKAFLCWSFQWEYDLSKISQDDQGMTDDAQDKRSSSLSLHLWDKALTEPLIRKRHAEKILRTSISSVLSIRLREGYCIKEIAFLRGGKELVVKLLLLWKQNAHIEYTATATWPVPVSNAQTKIEIVVHGTYGFLHDVYSKQLYFTNTKGYRANVVETFNHTLKNLEMTDALLVSLQSFSSNELYYSTPECVRRGVPLFHFPPNSSQPVLVLEQAKSRKSSKSQEAQFAVFWRTILTLDVNTWQRWMHCHRINMVLEHDRPLPKSLFLPSTDDRFYNIQCRSSLSSLAAFLKQWSSFVLSDHHTYIKFVEREDPENPPKSFCIVRISFKASCTVIRIAFLGGTPGTKRHMIVNALRDELKAITAKFARSTKLSKDSDKDNEIERQIQEKLVCTKLLHKPLDRILVRYDEQPREFLVRPAHCQQSSGIIETYEPWMHRAKRTPESPLKVLSRFLHHQRWVFTLHPKGLGSTATPKTVSKILRYLTKIREVEGYRFVASNRGVTTMFKEFWVKETKNHSVPLTTCIVQFVMFPPLTSSSQNRVEGWALNNRLPEDERQLQLVVEVWVEPQHGVIMDSEIPEYLVGKQYFEIPAKIFEADLETISAWLTYDHIRRMCDDRVVISPDEAIVHIQSPPNDADKKSLIYEVPFPFDVMKILDHSRQAELWFSTLIEHERQLSSRSSDRHCNDILFGYVLEHMERLHDRELTLTAEDSRRFLDFSLRRIGLREAGQEEKITWRCFTRTDNNHLLLTFVPASFESLQGFARLLTNLEHESSVDPSLESKPSVLFRKRQASTFSKTLETNHHDDDDDRETVGKFWRSRQWSQRSCVDLSLFVYDFALSSLTENDRTSVVRVDDILLDYRNKLTNVKKNESLEKSKELSSHCIAIYELFLYCFVCTLFENLRLGEPVDDDNLDQILAICSDHILEEIDIFGFLGNVCGHIDYATNTSSESQESLEDWRQIHEKNAINFLRTNHDVHSRESLWGTKCEDLNGLHDFIQRRFDSVLGKYFTRIPNKRDHYFYRPYFLQDSFQSDDDKSDEGWIDTSSHASSDVVFETSVLEIDGTEIENVKSADETNTEDITDGSVDIEDDSFVSEDDESDYPSNRSDMQSSIKEDNIMEQLEKEHNVPLFLSLNCTIRDKSHLSSTMVSMPSEYLPACFADILDQASRDPDQFVDPSISSLRVTLDLICLVPPREPDYARLKSRSRYRARSSSVSSLSSDSPHEKTVRFENLDGAHKSVSVTASHDRESSLLGSGLPLTQVESIHEIRDDINWLLQDEIVFSLCHVPYISKSILNSVTEHIIKSQDMETSSSYFTPVRLDFVLEQEKSQAIFMEELEKTRICGYKLSKLGNYHYLKLSCSTLSSGSVPNKQDQSKTEHEKSQMNNELDSEDEMFVCFGSLFSDEGDFTQVKKTNERSSRHQSHASENFSEMWLILRKSKPDVIDVFFHTRDCCDGEYYYDLYTKAINEINLMCHHVNQKMLLRYVYDNKLCHPLLQPRSEADLWNESVPYSSAAHSVMGGIDGSQVVLQEYRYKPGHFECPVKWEANLPIHFRLKGNSMRNVGAARAKQALRTVLEKFSLNEKSSMYVYQEKNGNIYYFNLDASLCVSNEGEAEGTKDNLEVDENNQSPPVSPVSSCQSFSKTAGTAELEDELDEFSRKRSAGLNSEKDASSINEQGSNYVEECIKLVVHGVTEPSDEIKKDLVSVFQKRLDDYTLELITMALARNPNTKLALQDVQFIQPSRSPPSPFIQLVLPSFAAKNLHPFAFFFKQHLLNYLHSPKYATQTKNYHFKKFIGTDVDCSEALAENDVFIFTDPKAFTTAKKGVACMAVSITDCFGNMLEIKPEQKEVGSVNKEFKTDLKEITNVVAVEDHDLLPDNAIVVEISIWERGDVGMPQLKEQLKKSVRHALCDVLMEYYLLTASLSHIPDRYLKPSCGNAGYKNPHKLSVAVATHRRTPSAGSLGCGRTHNPKPQPAQTFRSLSSSPVWSSPSSNRVFKLKTPEILTTPPMPHPLQETCDKNISEQAKNSEIANNESLLSSPLVREFKNRSKSEDVGLNQSSTHFRPIGRSFSNPTPPVFEAQDTSDELKSGRFSPYETFTENELTESREFGEEAVRANRRHTSRNAPAKSTDSEDSVEQKEREHKEERRKYENGEVGELHSSFQGPVQELMQFTSALDTPSIHVQKETLLTRYSVDAMLYELMSLVKSICPDLNSRIYRAVPSSQSLCEPSMLPKIQYVLYDPIRPPLRASDDKETSLDKIGSYMATSARPVDSYLFISRNIVQWRNNLQKLQDPCHMEYDSEASYKDFYSSQQFQSWKWNTSDDVGDRGKDNSVAFSNCLPGFVSRQRLILIDIKDKEILATTYNLSNEINTQFSDRLTNLVNWNNARCHLVSCLFQQKMGLFHHSTFQGLNKNKVVNPFCESVKDHDLFSLLKQTAPEKSSSSQKQIPPVAKLLFEETLRDVIPPKPLQTTKHCTYRDPVKRHGAQFQEIRAVQIKKAVQNADLQKLFTSWLHRGGFDINTGDYNINLLKHHSRLVHCCTTPFLVCEEWISSIEEKANLSASQKEIQHVKQGDREITNQETVKTVKENVWHYKLREEFMNHYTQFLQAQKFALVQLAPQSAKVQRKPTKLSRKKAVSERPKKINEIEDDTNEKKLRHYLQKTIDGSKEDEKYAYDGGIMLIELGYEGCHFSVKLYAYESRRLLSCDNLNQQAKTNFLAECSKVRDLTHLNSFSYDFHLRHVQYFLRGQRLVFPVGFRLTSMLNKLMNVYIYPPKFSWNHVCKGQLSLPLSRLSRETVYNYIVEHCDRYKLSVFEMNSKDDEKEKVLVFASYPDKYEVSLVAKLNLDAEEGQLGVKFYVVKTHSRELFPKVKTDVPRRKQSSGFTGDSGLRLRQSLIGPGAQVSNSPDREPALWSHGTAVYNENIKRSSSSPQFITALPLSQSPSEELLRHLPSPNLHDSQSSSNATSPSLSQINASNDRPYIITGLEADPSDSLMAWDLRNLGHDADKCYNKLYTAVNSAQKDCLRDHLWHLLLKGASSEESGNEGQVWKTKGRRKTEHRKNVNDFTDAWTVPSSLRNVADTTNMMSFEDFECLLDLVVPLSLPVVDEMLKPFLSMDTAWYFSLWTTLASKFGENSREFSKSDSKVHYFVLFNPDNFDMFIFVRIHEEKRRSDVKIVNRIVPEENVDRIAHLTKLDMKLEDGEHVVYHPRLDKATQEELIDH